MFYSLKNAQFSKEVFLYASGTYLQYNTCIMLYCIVLCDEGVSLNAMTPCEFVSIKCQF